MSIFEYEALTGDGRLMKGTLEAADHGEAARLLTEMQLSVRSLAPAPPGRPKTRIGRSEFMLFNEQLAAITKAGIPLERSLRDLSADVGSRRMRELIRAIAADLEAGVGIEEAFEKRRQQFPPLYGQVVRAGVRTGRLSEMLTTLNRHLEMAARTRRLLFQALCYPTVVAILVAVVVTFMLIFVVPQFRHLFEDLGAGSSPEGLRLLFGIADSVGQVWLGVAGIAALIALQWIVLSSFERGRRFKERLVMGLPVLGRVYWNSSLARMASTMATLVAAECDLPISLRLASGASGSRTLRHRCEAMASDLEQGKDVPIGEGPSPLPQLFLYSIQVGSQRGDLADNLHGLAEMYARQAESSSGRLQAVLAPVLILAVGAFAGLCILAMFVGLNSIVQMVSM